MTVRPQVDGKLISVNYTEGQQVERGYVLAKIDPITYQAAYDQAVAKKAQDEATLANARLDLERYTRLVATNSIARQQLDTQKATVAQLEAQVKLDQAQIDNAKAILDYTTIVAPIAGRTGIRQVDQGNIVRASDATGIVVITQLQPISLLFTLPQQQLGDVNRAFAARHAAGRCVRPRQQDRDRERRAQGGRQPGRSDDRHDQAQGRVSQSRTPALARRLRQRPAADQHAASTWWWRRPRPCSADRTAPSSMSCSTDNKVAVRPVTVSQQDETQAVIAKGLEAGERVVTTGFARLTAGAEVAVTNAEAGAAAPASSRPRRSRDAAARTARAALEAAPEQRERRATRQ